MLLVAALTLALQVLCLISLCIFAAQVTTLALLTEFLLLTGRTGLAEFPALSPDVEQEVRMPLWRLQTLCPPSCTTPSCVTPLQQIL